MRGLVCFFLCAMMTLVASLLCARALPRRAGWRRLAALLVPAGQLAFVTSVLWVATPHDLAPIYFAGVCAAHAFACLGICVLMHDVIKMRSAAINAGRLRAAQENARAADEYGELLKANVNKMKTLCDNFAAELEGLKEAVDRCGASGEGNGRLCNDGDAHEVLDFAPVEAALDNLEEKTRSSYCANKIADAILVLKAGACGKAGVDFSFEGAVPDELAVDELELCSVFSNLLDNAMNAASELSDAENGGECPHVSVSSTLRGAYLIVKVANSCASPTNSDDIAARKVAWCRKDANPVREHGWGLEIVGDICARYEGTFALEPSAAREVTATAILKAVEVVEPIA